MDNLILEIIDEEIKEGFKIDNDDTAEWALNKIAEEQADAQRYINVCETKIIEYQEKIKKYKEQLGIKTNYFKHQLEEYFKTVPHKESITQETYKLPSGILKLKIQKPEFKQDEEVFLKWLKFNKKTDYIETKEIPKWGELKKVCKVDNGKVITEYGEIVEGVEVVERDPIFYIDI
jgi:hypothetical protein